MSVKVHIDDGKGKALCKITERSGDVGYACDEGNATRRGGVDRVNLVDIQFPLQLGMTKNLCIKCERTYKRNNG